ncbi:hypothetical protein JCM8208_007590 [Rhodotorula glutinis]
MNSTEFLDIGRHCSDDSCRQLDFLPFSCPSCGLPFCAEHWKPDGGHHCASYDPALADNRIPSCPLCSTPISFPPGTDPNLPMDAHLSTLCPILHPHLAPSSSSSSTTPTTRNKPHNECRAPRCRTRMVVPIRCDQCRKSFCPAHRFPSDHACAGGEVAARGGAGAGGSQGAAASTSSAGASVKRALGGLLGSRAASTSTSTSSSSSRSTAIPPRPAPPPSRAGLAALRRAQQSLSAKPASARAVDRSAPVGTAANPLVLDSSSGDEGDDSDVQVVRPAGKGVGAAGARGGRGAGPAGRGGGGGGGPAGSTTTTAAGSKALASTGLRGAPSKRALQEQESARKALEVRAKKGLLTEDDKVRYATMQALQASAKGGQGKGDEACVLS